jgi:hypothetical protein
VLGGLLAAALLVIPASAQANFSLAGSTAKPTDLTAGAHSDFKIHLALPGSDDIKDLTISLPPGQVGNPLATPELCDPSQLPHCPADTAVGSAGSSVTISGLITQSINGTVYNLKPQAGEPARFGIVLNALPVALPVLGDVVLPPTVVQSGASLRQNDFGLDTIVHDIPHTATVLGSISVPIHINSMDLTLNGIAPGPPPQPFMRNPTSCDAHTVGFVADSYSNTSSTASDHFTPTNCGALDFSPAFTAEVGGTGQTMNGVPTTASTAILQDTDEAGLLNAVVKVPGDLNPNATIFFGAACDQASFAAGTCPASTVVGLATAASPLLSQPLIGNVELVKSTTSALPNLGLDLQGQLHLLLQGTTDISNGNTVSFNGLPDIPIARFQLTFTNPPGLLGTARDLCTPPAPLFHADFTGYNGAGTSVDSPAVVDGCGAGSGAGGAGVKAKCKKHKKKHKKHRAAASKKKHKKKHCKKKRKHKKRR